MAVPPEPARAAEDVAENRPVIRVVAAVIVDASGRLLLVRKTGTRMFMQPGGKPEPGESGAAALARELREEIGLDAHPRAFERLGLFRSDAANEPGHALEAEVFRVPWQATAIAPAAEIAELVWLPRVELQAANIAPLVQQALPFIP